MPGTAFAGAKGGDFSMGPKGSPLPAARSMVQRVAGLKHRQGRNSVASIPRKPVASQM